MEDKPISLVDIDYLYVTMIGTKDTFMTGHTLTLVKQDTPVKLKVGYQSVPLFHRAFLAIDESYRKNIIAKPNWADSIHLDRTKWTFSSVNSTGREFEIDASTVGSMKLTINASDALPVILTDTLGGTEKNRLLSGDTIKGHEMTLSVNIVNTGVLFFKPKDEDYHEQYGFDDALTIECQQSGDYEKLNIDGMDYYVPWLGIIPNTETEIKLEYKSGKIENSEGYKIMLECDNEKLRIDRKFSQIYDIFQSKKIKIESMSEADYYVYAYLVSPSGERSIIGKLKVQSRKIKETMIVQIIRVKRSDEENFPIIDKGKILSDVNGLFKQTFNQFELDDSPYTDTLIINKRSQDLVKIKYFTDSINWKFVRDVYYVFILNNQGVNINRGEASLANNIGRNVTLLLGNTRQDVAAHELGHNMGLPHTFEHNSDWDEYSLILSNKNRILIPKYSTRNIMDYTYDNTPPTYRRYFFKYQIEHFEK